MLFSTYDETMLSEKSSLDIGTDCIKPFYVALKFKPRLIIGIDEGLLATGSEIQRGTKLLTDTKTRFYNCDLFDEQKLNKIIAKEKVGKFDFILTSKSLHHLRAGKCITKARDKKHECTQDESECIYDFEEERVFSKLLQLGKRAIIYETFAPCEEDADKTR